MRVETYHNTITQRNKEQKVVTPVQCIRMNEEGVHLIWVLANVLAIRVSVMLGVRGTKGGKGKTSMSVTENASLMWHRWRLEAYAYAEWEVAEVS
jgi:hypothetical protein